MINNSQLPLSLFSLENEDDIFFWSWKNCWKYKVNQRENVRTLRVISINLLCTNYVHRGWKNAGKAAGTPLKVRRGLPWKLPLTMNGFMETSCSPNCGHGSVMISIYSSRKCIYYPYVSRDNKLSSILFTIYTLICCIAICYLYVN